MALIPTIRIELALRRGSELVLRKNYVGLKNLFIRLKSISKDVNLKAYESVVRVRNQFAM